jgi:lipoprotein Spr
MGNGSFLHSSIKGVQFTELEKSFYKDAYWTARRIMN